MFPLAAVLVVEVIMGGPARPEKVRVWVLKYGPMDGFGYTISGPLFLGRVWDLLLARGLARPGPKGGNALVLVVLIDRNQK